MRFFRGFVITSLLLFVATASPVTDASAQSTQKIVDRPPGRERLSRNAALDRLGKRLPDFARRHHFDESQLRHALLHDTTLRLSVRNSAQAAATQKLSPAQVEAAAAADAESAELLFIDEAMQAGGVDLPPNPSTSQIPDEQTFALHSRPGAKGMIYINFQGSHYQSDYWNDGNLIDAKPYSTDGDPAFSSAELNNIKAMWLQVSEDYAPFDVDVTTQRPMGGYDVAHSIEVIVTPTNSWYPNAGGICYVGSFNWSTTDGKVCWVFPPGLANNPHYIAEAISHEAGHSFGLYHWSSYDSSGTLQSSYYKGTAAWAPIMGASYYATASTWCKGDYPNAGTSLGYGQLQNDVSKINSSVGSTIADETGSDKAGAVAIDGTVQSGTISVNQTGVIASQTDLDVYRLEVSGGNLSLVIRPSLAYPDLDFKVRVLDASYQALSTQNPDGIADVYISLANLARGTYYLEISPVGYGDFSTGNGYPAYSSLGRYYISGMYATTATSGGGGGTAVPTPTPGPTPDPARCVRHGWSDTNCSGVIRKVLKVSFQ